MFDMAALSELVSDKDAVKRPESVLSIFKEFLGLKNIAYLATHMPPLTRRDFYINVTYDDKWIRRYTEEKYLAIDPVLPAAINSILPIDWSDLRQSSGKNADFFKEARRYDVGHQGLTVPIRGVNGERAFFSVTLDATDAEWRQFKNKNMANLQILSFFFHQNVVSFYGLNNDNFKLSQRQLEVLTWVSRGKTMQDVADILGISVHTIHTYIDTARSKLCALNTTHAVAKAIQYNLISPPDH